MTLDELEERIARIAAQNFVLRDFVVWLLAREIGSSMDPESTIRLASNFGDFRISQLSADSAGDLQIAEIFQQEKDWIIAAASKILKPK